MKSWLSLIGAVILPLIVVFLFQYSKEIQIAKSQRTVTNQVLTGAYDPAQKLAYYKGKTLRVPGAESNTAAFLTQFDENTVLGETTTNVKRIYVDLTNQRLYAYEGDTKVYDFLVSTGKWGRTPTGTFRIWIKLRYTTMSGGSKALNTYYYLPNVPFTMFFANDQIPRSVGYGIHGTYWHNNFGHPMSHGCINMKNEDVEQLYYWAEPNLGDKQSIWASADNPGTEVIIYGKAPPE